MNEGPQTPEKPLSGAKKGILSIKKFFHKPLKPAQLQKQYTLKNKANKIAVDGIDEDTPEAALLRNLHSRSVFVRLISGTGLRAADSNNLSDPYVVLKLGEHSASSRVEPKTLNPLWEETFIFSCEDVKAALENGQPWIEFLVYDKDLLSSDDFLGQATVSLGDLDIKSGATPTFKLPLAGIGRGGRKEIYGEILVAVWFASGDSSSQDADCALTLMPQPGFTGAPQLVRSRGSCLYEEPLFAVLSFKVDGISGITGGDTQSYSPVESPRRKKTSSPRLGDEPEAPWPASDDEMENGNPWGEDEEGELSFLPPGEDEGDLDEAPCSPRTSQGQQKNQIYLYCRILLGSQARVTRVVCVKNGTASWAEPLVFAVPLPMRDRTVRVEVWRTSSSRRKGRAAFAAQIPLFDTLPKLEGTSPDLRQQGMATVPLLAVGAGHIGEATSASLQLSSAVADLDGRRVIYCQPILEPRVHDGFADAVGSGMVSRLQSSTRELTDRELKMLGKLTASEFRDRENKKLRNKHAAAVVTEAVTDAATQVTQIASHGANKAMAYSSSWLHSASAYAQSYGLPGIPFLSPIKEDEEGDVMPVVPATPAPVPLACLRLGLRNVILRDNAPMSSAYCVMKCGSSWGRTPMVKVRGSSEEVDFGPWRVEIPVFDPATVLVFSVFRKLGLHHTKGPVYSHPVMVGKLRVRLSTLEPGREVTMDLPLLTDRKKGASRVGSVTLSMHLTFESPKARLKALVAPPLPKENYIHGIATKHVATVMLAARRRMVTQWLDTSSPRIPAAAVASVEDTEREEFNTSRLKANARRIRLSLTIFRRGPLFIKKVSSWDSPALSCTACAVGVATVYYPSLVLGAWLLKAAHSCYKSIPGDVGMPSGMEHDPPEVESEDDEVHGSRLDVATSNPYTILKRKYQKLLRITLTVQNILDDLATTMEKLVAFATWQDPLATMLLVGLLIVLGVAFLVVGARHLTAFVVLFVLRPPRMRTPWTPAPVALFNRLPSRADRIM